MRSWCARWKNLALVSGSSMYSPVVCFLMNSVSSSYVRLYAEMWSGLSAMAHCRVSSQLSIDCPGMENMRSMLISGMLAFLSIGTVS